jgi:methylthioribose-1-phosphate isomerase
MIVQGVHRKTVWFEDDRLIMINQPLLPHRFETIEYTDYRQAAVAIKTMVVRGAPAIGATAAYAMALAELQGADLDEAAILLKQTRPTAQDLFFAVDSILSAVRTGKDALDTARAIASDYEHACRMIGEHGAGLITDGMTLNTHCNAGWLATVDWGTATAPMYVAKRYGVDFSVLVDETRPRCQGSRITAFELGEEGIKHAVIADNATGYLLSRGEIDLVIVGSDRIAMNGDIANKIGTYTTALAAREHGIPFYVAAPKATIDPECPRGADIPIEERGAEEVTCMFGADTDTGEPRTIRIAPLSSAARNPAFDVTPASCITGIITETGIYQPKDIANAL